MLSSDKQGSCHYAFNTYGFHINVKFYRAENYMRVFLCAVANSSTGFSGIDSIANSSMATHRRTRTSLMVLV